MKNNNWFLNPTLSQRLIEKGVTSQFQFFWNKNPHIAFDVDPYILEYKIHSPTNGSIRVIHVFDLMLPSAAIACFGDDLVCESTGEVSKRDDCVHNKHWNICIETPAWRHKTEELFFLIQSNGDIEWYIKETMV